jgi:hypothetical protein
VRASQAPPEPQPPRSFDFDIIFTEPQQFPAFVDSNSPVFWDNGALTIFNSAWSKTFRTAWEPVDNLTEPLQVELPQLERPGSVWIEALWSDPATALLYGWYHFEPADLGCQTAPIIGAAVSYDNGITWEDRGFVIDSAYSIDCDYNNGYFTGGTGDFSVIVGPNNLFFYFLFSNYAGPLEEQGIAVARGLVADKGRPETVFKFYNGSWTEPAMGGRATALFPSSTGWKGPFVEAFWGPSVHWNSYLQSYVALLNHTEGENWMQEGIYITFSQDLLKWTAPRKILETNDWYPQVVGLGPGETDSLAGQQARVFVAGVSNYVLQFRLSGDDSELGSVTYGSGVVGDKAPAQERDDEVVGLEGGSGPGDAVGGDADDADAPVAVDGLGDGGGPEVGPGPVEDDDPGAVTDVGDVTLQPVGE